MHAGLCIFARACMQAVAYLRMNACMHACVLVYVCMYVRMYACMDGWM